MRIRFDDGLAIDLLINPGHELLVYYEQKVNTKTESELMECSP